MRFENWGQLRDLVLKDKKIQKNIITEFEDNQNRDNYKNYFCYITKTI